MTVIGTNTLNADAVMSFVSRIEERERAKQEIADEIKVIYAEVQTAKLSTPGVRGIIKARKLKPSQFRELEDVRDVYFHAAGLLEEPPLFRSISALAGDDMSKQAILDRFAELVPMGGSITVDMDGPPIKIARDKLGAVTMTEVVEKPVEIKAGSTTRTTTKVELPDVDGDGAEKLGAEAFKADQPIISNPFPFADARRPRWDLGWRRESGGDGMGPEDED